MLLPEVLEERGESDLVRMEDNPDHLRVTRLRGTRLAVRWVLRKPTSVPNLGVEALE